MARIGSIGKLEELYEPAQERAERLKRIEERNNIPVTKEELADVLNMSPQNNSYYNTVIDILDRIKTEEEKGTQITQEERKKNFIKKMTIHTKEAIKQYAQQKRGNIGTKDKIPAGNFRTSKIRESLPSIKQKKHKRASGSPRN